MASSNPVGGSNFDKKLLKSEFVTQTYVCKIYMWYICNVSEVQGNENGALQNSC